ncbi:RNA editing complex protein MP61 [Novymonas esmeraldas]|uniref:RNA editing complex protein MP61 n=1 Tax=Novymonas esmeraldas TaxID=1808958 RepID=A0AAW0F7E6_9TRYP
MKSATPRFSLLRRLQPPQIAGLVRRVAPVASPALSVPDQRGAESVSCATETATRRCSSGVGSSDGSRPPYVNFSTVRDSLTEVAGSGKTRRSRHTMSSTRTLPLLMAPYSPDPGDPMDHLNIFRRDFLEFGVPPKQGNSNSITVDVSLKRFLDMFADYDSKRCKLCNETFTQWHIHYSGFPHSGREGMLMELLRPYCGTPDEIVELWWRRLNRCVSFQRIPALSHNNFRERKQRLLYLLRVLKDRSILVEVFSVGDKANASSARSFEFERLEFIGDNVVKYVLNNILTETFPVREGGTRGRLTCFQFVMDGNDGLARVYDHLDLQLLTSSSRVVSKFKSDVIETLFAELQMYLWQTEHDVGTSPLVFPFTREIYTLRAIVMHVMYELAIEMFLFNVRQVLASLHRVVRERQLQFVNTDPALKPSGGGDGSGGSSSSYSGAGWNSDSDTEGLNWRQRRYTSATPAVKKNLLKNRTLRGSGHGSDAAYYHATSNYDNFKRVVSIGGLLPRPFTREELSVLPQYMPHLQRDDAMTRALGGAASATLTAVARTLSSDVAVPDKLRLSSTRTSSKVAQLAPLSIPRLKDEELVPELI